jgi:1,2-diacylglycerol 3-beta-glucosyltransferase
VRLDHVVRAADASIALVGLPFAAIGGYLAAISLPRSLKTPVPSDQFRLVVVVPAHNEQHIVAITVKSLLATDYPSGRRRVVVVADNCSDETESVARNAGAEVLVRTDLTRRGKGYALDFAFGLLAVEGWADGVVVVDADTIVDPNLLGAFGARFAQGEHAMQANYMVQNPNDSWRTRLMNIAFTAFHEVRGTGREALGLSAGLRGNGMGFSMQTVQAVPHQAYSVVEDLEYGLMLGLHGVRVAYVHEANISGAMPADSSSSASQRERWERGRETLKKMYAKRLVRAAFQQRSPMLADLAADVMMPPLGKVVAPIGLGAAAAATMLAARQTSKTQGFLWSPVVFGLAAAGLGLNVAEGWRRSGAGLAGFKDLAQVPKYVLWKVAGKGDSSGSAQRGEWVRTTRSHELVVDEKVS